VAWGQVVAAKYCAALCVFLGVASTAFAAEPSAPASAWNISLASEVRYYTWSADRGNPTSFNQSSGGGSELYVPYALQLSGQPNPDWKISLLGRGGWVSARQITAGQTGAVETVTDTVASGTVTYVGIRGFQPFASLATNIPTGRSSLPGNAAYARMDPDLVEISTFGEGWNIGPTAGFNLPFTQNLVAALSVGYTWRGAYNRERPLDEPNPTTQSPTSINPGEVITYSASLGYQDNVWSWSLVGSVSGESATKQNGSDLYQPGLRYFGSGTVGYRWPAQWGQTTLNASAAHSLRNDVLFIGTPALLTEMMNTNANVFRVGAQHLFAFDRMAIGPTGSYLYRDQNSYDSYSYQFVPEKQRWAAGGLVRYAASENMTLNVRVERVWTLEDDHPAIKGQQFSSLANAFVPASAVPTVSSEGWMVAGGLNVKF
jgi:hypothetical protein